MPNNLLLKISKELDLTYNLKSNSLYGLYRNYNISLQSFSNVIFITIPLKLNELYTINNMTILLDKIKNNYTSIESAFYKYYYISIKYNINEPNATNSLISLINSIINEAYSCNLKTCCPQCGEKADINPFLVRYQIQLRCSVCITKIEDNIKPKKKHNNNSFKSIVAAIVGCVLGGSIWLFLSYLKWFPLIAVLFISLFSIIGYKKFTNKMNFLNYFVVFIISIIAISIAEYFSLTFNVYYSQNYPSIIDAARDISYYIGKSISWASVIKESLIGYLINLVIFIIMFINFNGKKNKYSLVESLSEI